MGKKVSKDGETRKGIDQEALIKLLVERGVITEEELLKEIKKIKNKKGIRLG
jgi:hypothetical protein